MRNKNGLHKSHFLLNYNFGTRAWLLSSPHSTKLKARTRKKATTRTATTTRSTRKCSFRLDKSARDFLFFVVVGAFAVTTVFVIAQISRVVTAATAAAKHRMRALLAEFFFSAKYACSVRVRVVTQTIVYF